MQWYTCRTRCYASTAGDRSPPTGRITVRGSRNAASRANDENGTLCIHIYMVYVIELNVCEACHFTVSLVYIALYVLALGRGLAVNG